MARRAKTSSTFVSPSAFFSVRTPSPRSARTPLKKADGEVRVGDVFALLSTILDEARKGYSIQRYKGLGEMNPDQLWTTTMNPENRVLLQVKVEDLQDANDAFQELMGDRVEPRREFIERNALRVQDLDI